MLNTLNLNAPQAFAGDWFEPAVVANVIHEAPELIFDKSKLDVKGFPVETVHISLAEVFSVVYIVLLNWKINNIFAKKFRFYLW